MSKAKRLKLYVKILCVGLAALCVMGGAAGVARAIVAGESKTFYAVPINIIHVDNNYYAFMFHEISYQGNPLLIGNKTNVMVSYSKSSEVAMDLEQIINSGKKPLLKIVVFIFETGNEFSKKLKTFPYVYSLEYFKVVEEEIDKSLDEKLLQTIMS